jgi:hypothetical protein
MERSRWQGLFHHPYPQCQFQLLAPAPPHAGNFTGGNLGVLARSKFLPCFANQSFAKPCTGSFVLSSLQKSKCHPGGWTGTFGTGSGSANHAFLIVVQAPPKRSKKEKSTKQKASDQVTALFKKNGWSPFPFQKKAWSAYAAGESGLIHAPTGTGKTYAAWAGPLIEWMEEHRASLCPSGHQDCGFFGSPPAGIGQGHHPFPSAIWSMDWICPGRSRSELGIPQGHQGKAKKTLSLLPGDHPGKPIPSPLLPRNQGSLF